MLKYKRRSRLRNRDNLSTGALILLEIVAIAIAIVLGFIVNEWRESRNNQKVTEKALASIASEFIYNHNRMIESYEYYSNIVSQIDSLYQAGETVTEMYGYELKNWSGAMPPMLRSSSYQMTLTTGIFKDIPYEKANSLAFIYNLQSLVEKLDDASIINFSQDSGFAALRNVRHLFNLYIELIPSVLGVYQEVGLPILREYGYDTEVSDGVLKNEMLRQMQYFDLNQYE